MEFSTHHTDPFRPVAVLFRLRQMLSDLYFLGCLGLNTNTANRCVGKISIAKSRFVAGYFAQFIHHPDFLILCCKYLGLRNLSSVLLKFFLSWQNASELRQHVEKKTALEIAKFPALQQKLNVPARQASGKTPQTPAV